MRPSLCHATRITPLPLHPLDAWGRVQVAGERAADDRHIESCGGCLSHTHTCACIHNHTDYNRLRRAATDGDVIQMVTIGMHSSSEAPVRLRLVIRFAGLDKAVVPAGIRILPRGVAAPLLLGVGEDRQLLWLSSSMHQLMHMN